MPETNLAVMQQGGGQIVVSREWENQRELIMRTVAPGLNADEFALFLHVCHVRHLDPLQRQVHAVKRRTKDGDQWVEKMTIQTGIDGYRAIANRTGLYMPSDKEARIESSSKDNSDLRVTMWVKKYHPLSASWHEFSACAYYREFVQTYKDQGGKHVPNSMWLKMPVNQLTKCAEALALRKGWPEELGQIYTDEEMQQADSTVFLPPDPQTKSQQNKTQKDLGTMKPSTEPNRGHGNEGTQRKPEATICAECRQTNGHADDCKMSPKNTAKKGNGKNSREEWAKKEGHDPKVHISFDEGIQLFEVQRTLGITEEQMKGLLDKEFEIQHRYLIRKADFQMVLDKINDQFGPKQAAPPEDDGEQPALRWTDK